MSKLLWSLSYVFWTAGLATLLLLILHVVVDGPILKESSSDAARVDSGRACASMRCSCKVTPVSVLLAAGCNPLTLYVVSGQLSQLLSSFCVSGAERPSCKGSNSFNHYVNVATRSVAGGSEDWGIAVYALLNVLLMLWLGWFMYRRGIFIKL